MKAEIKAYCVENVFQPESVNLVHAQPCLGFRVQSQRRFCCGSLLHGLPLFVDPSDCFAEQTASSCLFAIL
jgi:hypothetical protein